MKWINARKWGTAVLIVLMGFGVAGCGGGGGGGDDDDSGGGGGNLEAPSAIGGNEVTFYSGTLGTRAVTFNTDNSTWSETREGGTVTGNYQYSPGSGRTALLVIKDQGEDQAIMLNFNSENSGAFAYRDARDNGTFEMRRTDGGGNGPPPGGGGGLAVSSLAGKTMYGTRTYTSTGPVGQTHVYTFTLNSFHDSDPPEESDGSYAYTPSGNNATLQLDYRSPAGFNGDKHALNMTFHTESAGVFESTYTRRDGTVITINGTFQIE